MVPASQKQCPAAAAVPCMLGETRHLAVSMYSNLNPGTAAVQLGLHSAAIKQLTLTSLVTWRLAKDYIGSP